MKTRVSTNTPASLLDSQGNETACIILDLSVDGFRVKLEKPAEISKLVKLKSGGELYDIEIRWASGLELGGLLS